MLKAVTTMQQNVQDNLIEKLEHIAQGNLDDEIIAFMVERMFLGTKNSINFFISSSRKEGVLRVLKTTNSRKGLYVLGVTIRFIPSR
jgi:hypothetical protein